MMPIGAAVLGERRAVARFHGHVPVGSIGVGRRLHVRLVHDRSGSSTTMTMVRMSPWRVMNSVMVYMSLV